MKFKDDRPIYVQIQEDLCRQIITGKLTPSQKIPSVRSLATHLMVNVNTIQKALKHMTMSGLLITKRGEGNFVTNDKKLLEKSKEILSDLNKVNLCII
ncbi:GntR family transcriptional regulator [uncultured Lactobacillus sp.]|uniref:GntR family transcriptional regulator n=1 Tax=uncultured Lactobacillus sp. TaxID=153152 RepID=UPI003429CBA4